MHTQTFTCLYIILYLLIYLSFTFRGVRSLGSRVWPKRKNRGPRGARPRDSSIYIYIRHRAFRYVWSVQFFLNVNLHSQSPILILRVFEPLSLSLSQGLSPDPQISPKTSPKSYPYRDPPPESNGSCMKWEDLFFRPLFQSPPNLSNKERKAE